MTDYYRTERQSYARGQEETREAKAEMGGLSKRDVRKAREEEDWKNKTEEGGKYYQMRR